MSEKTMPSSVDAEEEPSLSTMPAKIGPYRIESLFSHGGMSLLYLGKDPETKKTLIVKVLSPKYSKNKEVVDRFLKEAKIIGMTNHPNIVKLYGQGEWEQGLYIAMEFVQGVSLRQFIQQKSLSQRKALEILLQVAYALCHLHTYGVIHRDLKPENILITETGQVKVIDFGIAQLLEELSKEILPQKKLIGTPSYMSPEQRENPSNISFSSDIFSLGMIGYELLLGRKSHGSIDLSLLPKGLQKIIDKALKVSPKERYQDIVDFIMDISEFLQKSEEKEDSGDYFFSLQETQKKFFERKIPSWGSIDFGISLPEGACFFGFFLDFFQNFENQYMMVFARSEKEGFSSILATASLLGMVRSLASPLLNLHKKNFHPATFLSSLNQNLLEDQSLEPFSFSLLLFDTDSFSLASCGQNTHFLSSNLSSTNHSDLSNHSGHHKLYELSTPNPLLATEPHKTFVETSSSWNIKDRLIFTSPFPEEKKNSLKKELSQTLHLPAKLQADHLKKFLQTPLLVNKPPFVIILEKIF
jgi:hypothetical protein